MVLGLGSWTVWEQWYYIHLIDDAAYKVTAGSPLRVLREGFKNSYSID